MIILLFGISNVGKQQSESCLQKDLIINSMIWMKKFVNIIIQRILVL